MNLIQYMCSKTTLLKLRPHLPWANELTQVTATPILKNLAECFKITYEFVNLGELKSQLLNKLHSFQCMGKIFCVEFQRVHLKFHTKYSTHTLVCDICKYPIFKLVEETCPCNCHQMTCPLYSQCSCIWSFFYHKHCHQCLSICKNLTRLYSSLFAKYCFKKELLIWVLQKINLINLTEIWSMSMIPLHSLW